MAFKKVLLIVFLLCLLLLGLFYKNLLELPADFLIIDNPVLSPADVAIVLSGEIGERVDHAAELYKKGLVKFLLLSGATPGFTVNQMAELAINAGVPKSRIFLEPDSTSTYETAVFCKNILNNKNLTRAIVVTSSYHSRRARWVFKKVFQNDKIKVQFCYPPKSWFQKPDWWKKSNHRLVLKREYERLIWYYINYGLLNRKK